MNILWTTQLLKWYQHLSFCIWCNITVTKKRQKTCKYHVFISDIHSVVLDTNRLTELVVSVLCKSISQSNSVLCTEFWESVFTALWDCSTSMSESECIDFTSNSSSSSSSSSVPLKRHVTWCLRFKYQYILPIKKIISMFMHTYFNLSLYT